MKDLRKVFFSQRSAKILDLLTLIKKRREYFNNGETKLSLKNTAQEFKRSNYR